jgi:predicted nucleotidyltransferase
MEIAAIREKLLAALPRLREQYGVKQFWLFGSRARRQERPGSDIDLLVDFERRGFSLLDFIGLEQDIEELLGLKVDLVDIKALREELRPVVLPQAISLT